MQINSVELPLILQLHKEKVCENNYFPLRS